jgi:lipid A ethanolaminephosphotransferase
VDRIAQLIRESDRSFVYFLKAGAHIHYEGRYPEEERHFAPTLRPGELDELNFEGANRTRTLNSYLNALRWSVDEFWRDLLAQLEATGKPVLVVYTSDHGQSLLEVDPSTGRPETLSHNRREDPAVFQAMVPLFAVGVGGVADWLRARFDPSSVGSVDQFSLFPTLLVAAGYDAGEVALRYGPTIFDPLANRSSRRFISGDLFDPQGFRWNDFRQVARPPAESE